MRDAYEPNDKVVVDAVDALSLAADDVFDEVKAMASRRIVDRARIRALVLVVLDAADMMSPLPDDPDWMGA